MEEANKHMDSKESPVIKDDEIDLIEVAKIIWAGRKLILKVTAIFFVLGLIIAFGSKVEYEASCKLMPESQEGMKQNMGGLGGLAGLAGINLDMGGTNALTPELYPQISQSTPFILKVWDEPIFFKNQGAKLSSYLYFKEYYRPSVFDVLFKYTVLLPFQIKKWLGRSAKNESFRNSNEDILNISYEDNEYLIKFKKRISVDIDSKSGVISMSTRMPDAIAAAELAQISIEYLTEYITNYKIEKARINYDFIKERFKETKTNFDKTQDNLAEFNDRNRNVVTASAQTELQKLQNEYNINFEVYKGLATQLEQAKITLKEKTPVFTILEPVIVPYKKSSPKRAIILLVALFIGGLTGMIIVYIRPISNK